MPTTYTLIDDPSDKFEIVDNTLRLRNTLLTGTSATAIVSRDVDGVITQHEFLVDSINRVRLIKTSPGGRPNIIPASFYYDGQDELIDPVTHPHIMDITHTAIKDGFWDDATVWSTGTVPGTGAKVSTGEFHVQYRGVSDAILDSVLVPLKGKLSWDQAGDTRMRLYYGMSMGIVEIDDTTESATLGKRKHEIIFHAIRAPGTTTELGFMFMGPTRMNGSKKKGTLRLGAISPATVPGATAGLTQIVIPGISTSGWRVQDDIVIGATDYINRATTDPQYQGPASYYGFFQGGVVQKSLNAFQFSQNEQRKITNITGDVVTLDSALTYNHVGLVRTLPDGKSVTIAPVVSNPCRNICFRSASAEQDGGIDATADLTPFQKRAHLMFMRNRDVDRRYIEVQNMGRTEVDVTLKSPDVFPYKVEMAGGSPTINAPLTAVGGTPLENPLNVRGRYSFHDHWCDGPYAASEVAIAVGCSVWAPNWAPPVPGWGFVQHGTRAHYEDCVAINFRGSGFQTELGNENGQWIDCTAMGGRGDGEGVAWGNKNEVYTNQNDSAGIGFANQSRALVMHGCIAVGTNYGYMWHSQKTNRQKRSPRYEDMRLSDPMTKGGGLPVAVMVYDETYGVENVQIPPFSNNEAHASRFGIKVVHRGGDGRKQDTTPMLVNEFHCLGVFTPVSVTEYSNRYYFKDCLWQINTNLRSTSRGAEFGNVTWGWCISNTHMVNYAQAVFDSGMGVNYEGHFIDITLENVDSFANFTTVSSTGVNQHQSRNLMGDWEETGTNTAIIRRHKIESSANLPTPYPLAPYGLKLPLNDPDGNPYPEVNPGDTPYAVLGDGINGAASAGISLTLNCGAERNRGGVYFVIRDSVGDRRSFSFMTSESWPQGASNVGSARNWGKSQPEQAVQRMGCWNDNGVWKARSWYRDADRFTHVRFNYYADWTLTNFPAAFLAAHDLGGPPAAPSWPDLPEATEIYQRPLTPRTRVMKFLSRTRLEAVEGQLLAHRLRPNEVSTRLSIVPGADSAEFMISSQTLRWAGDVVTSGSSTRTVTIRAEDVWGNFVETPHEVVILPDTAITTLSDDFNRADENLEARSGYTLLSGTSGGLAIRSNRLGGYVGFSAVIEMGQLSSTDLDIRHYLMEDSHRIYFRYADASNYMIFMLSQFNVASELGMVVNGTYTSLLKYPNQRNRFATISLRGRRFKLQTSPAYGSGEPTTIFPLSTGYGTGVSVLENDEHSEPGVFLLPANIPMGTKFGIRNGGADTRVPFLDDVTFTAIS